MASAARLDSNRWNRWDPYPGSRSSRAAARVFAVWLAISAVILLWVGRGLWAPVDDWMLTGARTDFVSLFRDHNQHFSLIPVLIYKAMFAAVGFGDYLPYRIVAVAVHLMVVVLLRVLMRGSGVGPWVATGVAGSFTLFNGGELSVALFQMPLALAFALGMVVMVSRPRMGPASFAGALVLGLCGIATSGVAVPVVLAAGVVAWRSHGLWRACALNLPIGAVYAAWCLWARPAALDAAGTWRPSLAGAFAWLLDSAQTILLGLGGTWWLAVVLLVGLAIGLSRPRGLHLVVPLSLLGACILLNLLAYLGRGWADGASRSRFAYLCVALVLPLVAAAWSSLAARNDWLGILIGVPLGVSVALNAVALDRGLEVMRMWSQGSRALVAAMLVSPAADTTPDDVRPWWSAQYLGLGDTTWGYLRQARDRGLLDMSGVEITPALQAQAIVRLRVVQADAPPPGNCRRHAEPQRLSLPSGTVLGFRGGQTPSALRPANAITVALTRFEGQAGAAAGYESFAGGGTLEVVGDDPLTSSPLRVTIAPAQDGVPFDLCR